MSQKKKQDAYTQNQDQPQQEQPQGQAPEGEAKPVTAETLEKLEQELAHARAAAAENMDKFVRAKAESENIQRRAQIDIVNAHKYAIEKFATELLSVRDSLELAQKVDINANNDDMLNTMHEGLGLTLKQLEGVFEKFNLQVIDPMGEKFDPERHQAMSMVETEDVAPNHVVTVVQKGCVLNDRLLRPAMVVIAKAKSEENQDTSA